MTAILQQTLAPVDTQLALFGHRRTINCHNMASARNAYGTAAQEIVYTLLGINEIKINGNFTTCFDGEKSGMYYEIKSTRQGAGKIVLYDWRMGKEEGAGVPLSYLVVCHGLGGQRKDILQEMADHAVVIYSIPAPVIHWFAHRVKLNHLNRDSKEKNNGYTRGGYKDGYRNLPLTMIEAECTFADQAIPNTIGKGSVSLRTFKEIKA